MEVNQLERLEAFEARDARQLTLATASLLINSCPNLVSLLDLSSWGGVQEQELAVLKERVQRENVELDLGEEVQTGEKGRSTSLAASEPNSPRLSGAPALRDALASALGSHCAETDASRAKRVQS